MVVNVVKSVSASDDSVTIVTNETTEKYETTKSIDSETTTSTTTKKATTTVSTTSTTVPTTKFTEVTATAIAEEKIEVNRTRFGSRRPSVGPSIKIHPFLSKLNEEKLKTTTAAAHPFLRQIKSTETTSSNTTAIPDDPVTKSATTTTTTATETTPLTTTRSSLFGRFSFLNRNRANLKKNEKTTPTTTTTTTTRRSVINKPNSKSFFSGFKSRLGFGKSKSSKPTTTLKPEEQSVENIGENTQKNYKNQIDIKEEKQEASKPSRLAKPSFIRPSHLNSLTRSKLPSSSTIEKPRPKRLPPPFKGSHNSLFSPRRPPSFSALTTKTTAATSTDSTAHSTSTQKQSVDDLIAKLNGDSVDNDDDVTIRPRAFKPKFGSGNKIREKLKAELAKGEEKDESIDDENDVEEDVLTDATTATTTVAKKFHSLLPTRGRGLSKTKPSLPRPTPTKFRSINSFRSRSRPSQRISDKPDKTPVVSEQSDSIFRPTVVSPQSKVTKDIIEVSVDSMHAGENDSSEHNLLTTKSPFQVLEDSADDQTHTLVNDHHPEIHFRHLQPDLLPNAPHETTVFELLEDTIDDREVTHEMIIPTTLTPRLLNKIPSTAEAFLPTVHEEMFLPTISQSEPAPTPLQPSTKPPTRRLRGRGRGRTSVRRPSAERRPAQNRRPSVGEVRPEVQESLRTRPTRLRTRTRSRVRTQTEQPEVVQESTELKEAPRSSFSRRPISRTRSNFIQTAPASKQSTGSRRNSKLRIRVGGRRRTTTETPSEATELPSTRQIEETSGPSVKGKAVDRTVFTVEPTEAVDTTLIVVSSQDLDSEKSTIRPGTFMPKQGADALRAKLHKELSKEREFTFGTQEVDENFELKEIPVAGPERGVDEEVLQLEVPVPGPERELAEELDIKPPPILGKSIDGDIHAGILPPPPPTQIVQKETSNPFVKELNKKELVNVPSMKNVENENESEIIQEMEESNIEEQNDEDEVEEPNNRQSRRFRPRGQFSRIRPNVKSNNQRRPHHVQSTDTVQPGFYDPRLKRQGGNFIATELNRSGRSTVSPPIFTDSPLTLNDLEESSLKSLSDAGLGNKIVDSPIKPFLLRGGKGERKLFNSRYKTEIKIDNIPEKESREKVSGPNPSIEVYNKPRVESKTDTANNDNILNVEPKNHQSKSTNKKKSETQTQKSNTEKKKNLLNLLKKESAFKKKKNVKQSNPKDFDFRSSRLEFGAKTAGVRQVLKVHS